METIERRQVPSWWDMAENFAGLGLRVKVERGRKWKGTGFFINTFTKSYQWGVKQWRSNNDYGVATTRYAKILDPVSGTINTVTFRNMDFVDIEKFFEEYKTEMKNKLEATTVEDLKVGDYDFSYSPYSGDSHRVAYGIEFGDMTFDKWLAEKHSNKFDLSIFTDIEEEEKAKKQAEFKATKMQGIIEWVKNNTDKTTDEEINELAERIYKKNYC